MTAAPSTEDRRGVGPPGPTAGADPPGPYPESPERSAVASPQARKPASPTHLKRIKALAKPR
jgi:hypothetical protein